MQARERRRSRRFILQTPARILLGTAREAHPGTLMNISLGGLFVTMQPVIAVGDVAFIQFDAPSRAHCEATGKVVHTLPFGDLSGYGIAFHIANDALVDFLHDLESRREPELVGILDQVDNVVVEIGTRA